VKPNPKEGFNSDSCGDKINPKMYHRDSSDSNRRHSKLDREPRYTSSSSSIELDDYFVFLFF